MKKSIAILASLVVLGAVNSQAAKVGVVNFNNWDSFAVVGVGGAAVDLANTYVQLQFTVGGTTSFATSSGTTTTTVAVDTAGDNGTGYFDGGSALLNEAAVGQTVSFTLLAWSGASSYDAASIKTALTWQQTVSSSWDNAQSPASPYPNDATTVLKVPQSIQLETVPEPSTIALGILGAGALLIRRRK